MRLKLGLSFQLLTVSFLRGEIGRNWFLKQPKRAREKPFHPLLASFFVVHQSHFPQLAIRIAYLT